MTAVDRIFNFSAGPAVLPMPVLEEAQRDLIALPNVGMSILEISHRSKTFDDILNRAAADIRELAGVPANYKILMLQADESAAAGFNSGLHRHGIVGGKGSERSETRWEGQRRRHHEGRELFAHPATARAGIDAGCLLCPHDE
jgi:hypothetical protein